MVGDFQNLLEALHSSSGFACPYVPYWVQKARIIEDTYTQVLSMHAERNDGRVRTWSLNYLLTLRDFGSSSLTEGSGSRNRAASSFVMTSQDMIPSSIVLAADQARDRV